MKPSIDYLNARRACKPASGGSVYSRAVKYAPDYEPDALEIALAHIGNFALWAEASRYAYLKATGLELGVELNTVDEIPF
jgi:hypothetical protein